VQNFQIVIVSAVEICTQFLQTTSVALDLTEGLLSPDPWTIAPPPRQMNNSDAATE